MSAVLGTSAQRIRPLRRWPAAATARVEAALDAVLADWADAWNVARPRTACAHVDADPDAAVGVVWHPLAAAPGLAWLGTVGHRRRAMQGLLDLGRPGPAPAPLAPLAAALAESAWSELAARLADRLAAADAPHAVAAAVPPPADARHWSGALLARWSLGSGAAVSLHLSEPAVRALGGSHGPATARAPTLPVSAASARTALGAQRATLRAVFATTTVDVGSLLTLAPGDVLPLAHPLDRPLALRVVAGDGDRDAPPIAHAHLGARGAFRAVALARGDAVVAPKELP